MAAPQLARMTINVNYDEEVVKISNFLQKFTVQPDRAHMQEDEEDVFGVPSQRQPCLKYVEAIKTLADRASQAITIELDDIVASEEGEELAERIAMNAKRYEELFYRAINSLLPETEFGMADSDEPIDVLVQQRLQFAQRTLQAQPDQQQQQVDPKSMFPPKLLRRYSVYFKPLSTAKSLSVRQAKGAHIGHLISIRGIVTRISDVKPYILVATYSCASCGNEVFQEVMSEQFTPISECPSDQCKSNNVKGKLTLQTRACRFARFQEAKIQELTDQVPMGHIPRSMTVYLYNEITRGMTAGDHVTLSGIYVPRVYTGFRAMRVGLLTDTYLEVMHVEQLKKQYNQYDLSADVLRRVDELATDPSSYNRLASSIAPEIFGHEDVKKALLLLMVGGVTKQVGEGVKIRGDINICLMGDPGVAKSQLLRWVSRVAPRGVYTTGKGSSGVGLTAAVIKDVLTGEMILEGGSLVLADNGICCIDEFDKMEEADRTAIHEVMEQQTVSISKAGINTTLNARTSILAAANPIHSRYNKNKTASENINLPPALLSRFDLLFLILDEQNRDFDCRMAEHILFVHRNRRQPDLDFEPLDATLIREYISKAVRFNPVITEDLMDFVVGAYVQKRQEAHEAQQKRAGNFTYTQPRTLLAILRMAQALARLRFSDVVLEADIREALRLMDSSKASLDAGKEVQARPRDAALEYYRQIKNLLNDRPEKQIKLDEVRNRLRLLDGFNEAQLQKTIEQYELLNVWTLIGQTLHLVDTTK